MAEQCVQGSQWLEMRGQSCACWGRTVTQWYIQASRFPHARR